MIDAPKIKIKTTIDKFYNYKKVNKSTIYYQIYCRFIFLFGKNNLNYQKYKEIVEKFYNLPTTIRQHFLLKNGNVSILI